uniref:ATP synthase CF0 subunit I n=1 Tax=Olisthodiscus luteus TaxID=83000 RepID=A0A7U0QG10_OLILU|nr:ATP synthase CF0 subunit I [Olisthodiscus luteus]QQW50516.1 ATP synthase CF0 subunit I [Olisthodiscus luteus]
MDILTFLISESESIKFEFDLFETNIINLVLLIALLINVGKNFLGSQLSERQQKILQSIEDSELQAFNASNRLMQVYKQLDQFNLILEKTKEKGQSDRELKLKENYNETKRQVASLFRNARTNLERSEKQLYGGVKENFANLALNEALKILKFSLTPKDHSFINNKYIEYLKNNISYL